MSQKYLIIVFEHKAFSLKEVPKTYDELVSEVIGHFKTDLPPTWSLKYEDSDLDLISLSHSEDYEGLLSEVRAAEEFVKVFVIVKEGQSSVAASLSKKEANELEGSMSSSEDSYNVLDSEANLKKEGQLSDDDVIDVPSLNGSQDIKEIEPKKEEDESKVMEKSLAESAKVTPSETEAVKEEKAEEPKEEVVAKSYAEIKEESLAEETNVENKAESMEKIEEVPTLAEERYEDEGLMQASQHSIISQKDVPDYTKNYEFYKPENEDADWEADRLAETVPLLENAEVVFKKPEMEDDSMENAEKALYKEGEEEETEIKTEKEVRGKPVHQMVKCDGCGKDPIEGIRYKCSVCEDFDFCEECEANVKHEHAVFLKIKTPEDAKELGVGERSTNILEEIDDYLYGLEHTVKEKVKKMMMFIKTKFSEEDNTEEEEHPKQE